MLFDVYAFEKSLGRKVFGTLEGLACGNRMAAEPMFR